LRTQGVPDVIGGEVPTRGLFGTGGEYGTGGLLTTFNQPSDPGKGMLDLFSNLPVVTGMEILQGGMTGKPIEQTLLPAFKTSLRTTAAVEKVKASKRKRDYINKYKDQVPEGDMELFLAFPEKYISAMLTKRTQKVTLADRAGAIFDRISKLPPKEQAEELANLRKTNPAEADLYKKMIKGGLSINDLMALMLGGGNLQSGSTKKGETGGTGHVVGEEIELESGKKGIVVEVDEYGVITKVRPK
jgi:hypothetical protein